MPKKNQIPHFTEQALADGTPVFHWKPSPRLRRAGWQNLKLGEGAHARKAAIEKALDRNEEVARWQAGAAAVAPAPKRVRRCWRDLLAAYRESDSYTDLKPKSRAEYDSRLRTLTRWANDADLLLDDLTREVVMDLRDTLVRDGRKHRTAAMLRVLGIVLKFGSNKGWLPLGLGNDLNIPEPPKRKLRLLRPELAPLLAAADALDMPHVALGIVLGFYTLQREGDLLATSAFWIKPIEDISAAARRVLAGQDGKVQGLHLVQEKTGATVAIALAPVARGAVEAALAANKAKARARGVAGTHLIPHPARAADACPDWKFQRDFRAAARQAAAWAMIAGDMALAAKLAKVEFRDLRRSGMCWMRDLGVPVALIVANSGNSIQETQKILDTYMPRDTRGAAEGMAMAVAAQAERDAAEMLDREGSEG